MLHFDSQRFAQEVAAEIAADLRDSRNQEAEERGVASMREDERD